MLFPKSFRDASAVLLVCALAAAPCCRGRERPNRVAERMVRAVMANDFGTIQETVDSAYQNQVMGAVLAKAGLSVITDGGIQGKFTELRAVTLSDDGKNAVVEIRGKLKVVVRNTPATVPLTFRLSLVKRGRRWYVTALNH